MDPADSWEKLSDALLGPFERDIVEGLTGAYRAMEPRIEQAFKRSLDGGSAMPLQRLLILRQQLGQELSAMRLPPELAQTVNQALLDGQVSSDFWALAELNKVKQEARNLTPEQAAQVFANASTDSDLLLGPGMAQQNPTALIAAAQRQNALANYAAGARGTQAFAALNRLVDVELRGRIIGAVEFHLAQGDSWRQLRSTLQTSVELTKSRAQTVARTEMAAAMVEGTKLRYEAEGIEQVQWQAVGSSRTCGYCAPRHGKVYKLGDVIAPAHPNCRCTVTPWDPEWVELGLVDPQAEAQSRAAVLADLEAAGKKPISGPTPFEKALGMEQAPEALWTPPRVGAKAQIPAKPAGPKLDVGPASKAAIDAAFIDDGRFDLGKIYSSQGFNQKPELVDTIDELLTRPGLVKGTDGETLVFFRGIPEESSVAQWQGLGDKGDTHYPGKGVYGNGSYLAAAGVPGQWAKSDAHNTAAEYARDRFSNVTASGLRDDAKIWRSPIKVPATDPDGNKQALAKAQDAARLAGHKEWEKWMLQTVKEATDRYGRDFADLGEAAAALGYDAYQVPAVGRMGREDYWVVLNRGSLVTVKGPSPVPSTREGISWSLVEPGD